MCVCVYGLELGEKRKKWKNISESIYVYIHTPKGIFSCVAAGLERNKWSRAGSDQSPEDPRIPRLGIGLSGHQKSWRAVAIAPGGPIPHWQLSARGGPLLLSSRAYPKLCQSLCLTPSPWNFISSLWLQESRSHSVPQVDPTELAGISKGGHSLGSAETPLSGFRNHFIKDRYPGWGLRTWRKLYGQKKDLQSWKLWKRVKGKTSQWCEDDGTDFM